MNYTVLKDQNLIDISVTNYGSKWVDGLLKVIDRNDVSLADELVPGTVLDIPEVDDSDLDLQYVKSRGIQVVTGQYVVPPPAAPSGLVLSAVAYNQINLSWTDNSDNEVGFDIERSLDGLSWVVVITTPYNATSYDDVDLVEDTLYYYRIRATGSVKKSAYTPPLSIKTPFKNPLDIYANGLEFWFRQDDVIFNGINVSQINDRSGKGRHLTQSTATRQPFHNQFAALPEGSLDGHEGIDFYIDGDGTDFRGIDILPVDFGASIPLPYYLFMVIRLSSGSPITNSMKLEIADNAPGRSILDGGLTIWDGASAGVWRAETDKGNLSRISCPELDGVEENMLLAIKITNDPSTILCYKNGVLLANIDEGQLGGNYDLTSIVLGAADWHNQAQIGLIYRVGGIWNKGFEQHEI